MVMKNTDHDAFSMNERELMEYYGYTGSFGRFRLRCKFARTWILHTIAHSTPFSNLATSLQRSRGVRIGNGCHISPYVLIDLLYPHLVTIGDNVTLGSNVMIFAHANPTTNLFLKENGYPRKVAPVTIKSGAILFPGCIVTAGVTIGQNSIAGVGSVVFEDIPDYCVVVGNPARIVKKIEH
jgi:acetyltransferase-like isoleucine patch superfamily enzyme